MTTTLRAYRFECCWLLFVLLLASTPRPTSAQLLNFEDAAADCPPCDNYNCWCVEPDRGRP